MRLFLQRLRWWLRISRAICRLGPNANRPRLLAMLDHWPRDWWPRGRA